MTRNQKNIYQNMSNDSKRRMVWNKGNINPDFAYDGKGKHKLKLIEERGHKCECCALDSWLDAPITLELDHIDGDNRNNIKSNLRLLCPNCHSLTPTWRGRNINTNAQIKTDEEFIDAISKSTNIRQALILLGLTPKGGNYDRPKKLIADGKANLKTMLR